MNWDKEEMFKITHMDETFEQIVDENYRRAFKELTGIINTDFRYDDEKNPYSTLEKAFMVKIAYKLEAILWVLVVAGNKAYEDVNNRPSIEYERWFLVAYIFQLTEVSITLGQMGGAETAEGEPNEVIIERLERMNKEFALTRMSNHLFNMVDFADGFKKITDPEYMEKAKESMERVNNMFSYPAFIDVTKVKEFFNEVNEQLLIDPKYIKEVNLSNEICKLEYKLAYTEEEATDPLWVDARIADFVDLYVFVDSFAVFAKNDFDLDGKLNVLSLINSLLMFLQSYVYLIIRDNVKYDCKLIHTRVLERFAELRHELGIEVDKGGNYIGGDDTNALKK